jgi:uncharacterized protein (UPF0261 family)
LKTIALLGTLNTKAEELNYIRERIIERGHQVVLIDLSLTQWNSSSFKPDIDQKQIAEESGMKLEELTSLAQEDACSAVVKGATHIVDKLFRSGKLDGIMALGGTVGTSMGCAVMRSLPLGIPKLMVSTYVSDLRPYVGNKDIVFFPSITDMFGLNHISRRILAKASGAIVGMVEAEASSFNVEKPLIGMSVRGDKAACVDNVKSLLEKNGFEVLCFHAVGQGLLLEELVREGLISGVLDLVPAEVNEYLFGGMFSAGPDRLEAAGEKGIPQLISTGGIEFVCFPSEKAIPSQFRRRKKRPHNPNVIAIWLNRKEIIQVAQVMAEKLNRAKGPTAIVIPMRGFGGGGWTIDPKLIPVLINTLKENLKPEVEVVELDAHINDLSFAQGAVDHFLRLMANATGAAKSD